MSFSFETPWTCVARQAPLSMGFPRQEYWGGLHFILQGNLLNPGIELASPALQMNSWPLSYRGSPCKCLHAKSLQSCLILCNPMDRSPPGSSVHRILQARILEWVAMPPSRGSSQPRDQTHISCIAGGFFTAEPLGTLKGNHFFS